MTFANDYTRFRFHQLPADTQVIYTDWEVKLAKRGSRLHVEQVLAIGSISEVIVRVAENFKLPIDDVDLPGTD